MRVRGKRVYHPPQRSQDTDMMQRIRDFNERIVRVDVTGSHRDPFSA